MRVTISIEGEELGDVTVTRESRPRTLGGSEGLGLLDSLIGEATFQARRAYNLDEED